MQAGVVKCVTHGAPVTGLHCAHQEAMLETSQRPQHQRKAKAMRTIAQLLRDNDIQVATADENTLAPGCGEPVGTLGMNRVEGGFIDAGGSVSLTNGGRTMTIADFYDEAQDDDDQVAGALAGWSIAVTSEAPEGIPEEGFLEDEAHVLDAVRDFL